MTEIYKKVNCPTCGAIVEWRPGNRFRPFCSERCKLLDLGGWAAERYRMPAEGESPGTVDPLPDG